MRQLSYLEIDLVLDIARLKSPIWLQDDSQSPALWLVASPIGQAHPTKLYKRKDSLEL